MKKIFLAIIALVALAAPHKAASQFRWGPTVGIDITTLTFKQDLFAVDQSMGFQAGVMGEMMFPGIGFGVDFGFQYTQRGATLHMGDKTVWQGTGHPRCYLHYAEIPFNLRFKWTRMQGLEDYVAPYVFGGPTMSFLVAHNKIEALDYAGADLGLQAGLGFEIMRRWQVQGSYNWGMTYALKTKLLDNFSARNRTWTIKVAYLF